MAIFQSADIPTMISDSPHELTAEDGTAKCWFDDSDQEVLDQNGGAAQIVRRTAAFVNAENFPTLEANDPVEVDGRSFIVWRKLVLGDGAILELWLRNEATS